MPPFETIALPTADDLTARGNTLSKSINNLRVGYNETVILSK